MKSIICTARKQQTDKRFQLITYIFCGNDKHFLEEKRQSIILFTLEVLSQYAKASPIKTSQTQINWGAHPRENMSIKHHRPSISQQQCCKWHWTLVELKMVNQQQGLSFKTNPGMRVIDRICNRLSQSDLPSHTIKRFTHQRCLLPRTTPSLGDICLHLISICCGWSAKRFRDIIWILERRCSAPCRIRLHDGAEKGFSKLTFHSNAASQLLSLKKQLV